MLQIWCVRWWIWAGLAFSTTSVASSSSQFSYQYQGRVIKYRVDSTQRVIDGLLDGSHGSSPQITTQGPQDRPVRLFQSSPFTLIPDTKVTSEVRDLGIPVYIGKGSFQTPAVLTDEMVLRPRQSSALQRVKGLHGYLAMKESPLIPNTFRVRFTSELFAARAVELLTGNDDVEFVHPNFIFLKSWRSRDFLESQQWHLKNVGQSGGIPGADGQITEAWKLIGKEHGTFVAVIDAGFEINHEDLRPVWAVNPKEIPGNGRDDDGNGLVDDVFGYNFLDDTAELGGTRLERHGTAVAGVLAAAANNFGVTGVCPACQLIPIVAGLRVMDDAEAFAYAALRGAQVISNSWGYVTGTPETEVLTQMIKQVAFQGRQGKGVPIVFAMNNLDQDDCEGPYPDISSLAAVVAVSGGTDRDKKVSYGAWGPCMELLAPTNEKDRAKIVTTDLSGQAGYNNGRYPDDFENPNYTNYFHGTSAAAPQVAGAMGFLLGFAPELTREQLTAAFLLTAEKIDPEAAAYDEVTGFSLTHGYGRLNLAGAVALLKKLKKTAKNPY